MNLTSTDLPYWHARTRANVYRIAAELSLSPLDVLRTVNLYYRYTGAMSHDAPWAERATDWQARLSAVIAAAPDPRGAATAEQLGAWADLVDDLLTERDALSAAAATAPPEQFVDVAGRDLLREPPLLRVLAAAFRSRADSGQPRTGDTD